MAGTTSGTITVQPQAAAGTYNLNLPTGAGTSGQPLLSGGGGATAMTFGTLGVAGGGTGAITLTQYAVLLGNGTGAVGATAVGTAGQLLIGQGAAANPAFETVSGDVTITSAGAVTIANNAVTYAKFQQVAASSLVGNPTGSLANAQGITLGATLAFSGTALQTAALTGDVTASANSFATTVGKINGATLGTTTATAGNLLIGSGTQWVTTAMSGNVTITSGGVTTIGAGVVTNAMLGGSIAASKLVGTDIATVGTITSGTWNGTTVGIGYGGTGQTTAAAARGSTGLNIDEMTAHGDSIYTILATDRTVATNAALTAARIWTLPAANAVNAGQQLCVVDKNGGVTSTNTLTLQRAGLTRSTARRPMC